MMLNFSQLRTLYIQNKIYYTNTVNKFLNKNGAVQKHRSLGQALLLPLSECVRMFVCLVAILGPCCSSLFYLHNFQKQLWSCLMGTINCINQYMLPETINWMTFTGLCQLSNALANCGQDVLIFEGQKALGIYSTYF